MKGRIGLVLLAGVATVATVGCSQVAVLAPVAGDAVTSVQIATADVLANQAVKVRTWPVCTSEGEQYTCKGATAAGQPITSQAVGDPLKLTVAVGTRVLYAGPLKAVITAAGRKP